jgi:hypothetical protein
MGLAGAMAMDLKLSSKVTQRSRSIAVQWVSSLSRPLNGYKTFCKPFDLPGIKIGVSILTLTAAGHLARPGMS